MTLCPNTPGHQCHCQPQEGMMCPYGPQPEYTGMTKEQAIAALEAIKGGIAADKYDAGYEKALEDVIEMLRRLPDEPEKQA